MTKGRLEKAEKMLVANKGHVAGYDAREEIVRFLGNLALAIADLGFLACIFVTLTNLTSDMATFT